MFNILVATLIVEDNKVLLVKEKKNEVKDLLNLPAGHLERNETLIEAAKREVMEETGLKINIDMLIDTQYFSKTEKDYVAFVFQGSVVKGYKLTNELDYAFYDIDFIKKNKQILRNDKLILSAIEKTNKGSKTAIAIIK